MSSCCSFVESPESLEGPPPLLFDGGPSVDSSQSCQRARRALSRRRWVRAWPWVWPHRVVSWAGHDLLAPADSGGGRRWKTQDAVDSAGGAGGQRCGRARCAAMGRETTLRTKKATSHLPAVAYDAAAYLYASLRPPVHPRRARAWAPSAATGSPGCTSRRRTRVRKVRANGRGQARDRSRPKLLQCWWHMGRHVR